MKPNKFLLLFFFVLSSCSLLKPQKVNPAVSEFSEEKFSDFYSKFSRNNKFRKSRTLFPLRYITIDIDTNSGRDTIKEEMLKVFPLELNRKKWKEKVEFTLIPVNSDSAKVIVSIEDTGYHVVMYFIKDFKNKKWYAVKIEDSST